MVFLERGALELHKIKGTAFILDNTNIEDKIYKPDKNIYIFNNNIPSLPHIKEIHADNIYFDNLTNDFNHVDKLFANYIILGIGNISIPEIFSKKVILDGTNFHGKIESEIFVIEYGAMFNGYHKCTGSTK